tara:strand:- start:537 stop:962 length:426 start_codon:yes stop_codon:yes gene_type:complete
MSRRRDTEPCPGCGEVAKRFFTPVGITGSEWVGGHHSAQLGRTFYSAAEVDTFCKENNLAPVSRNSTQWKRLRSTSKNNAEVEAKKEGFASNENRRSELKTKSRDYVAAARQEKIDEFHEEHGNEDKASVDTYEGWGPLPE